MDDFVPDPANYTMKGTTPILAIKPQFAPQIDPTDVKAVRAMVWDKLVAIASVMPPNDKALPILREIMDRIDGKPSQSVQVDAVVRQVLVNATIRFADEPVTIEHNP